jgi:hypothetical protein
VALVSLSDELRHRAQDLRDVDVKIEGITGPVGLVLANMASGQGFRLIVQWISIRGRAPELSLRVWRELQSGSLVPLRDVGLEIPYYRLPTIGEAVAKALELSVDNVTRFRTERDGKGGRR